jgi:hypothetical protein
MPSNILKFLLNILFSKDLKISRYQTSISPSVLGKEKACNIGGYAQENSK